METTYEMLPKECSILPRYNTVKVKDYQWLSTITLYDGSQYEGIVSNTIKEAELYAAQSALNRISIKQALFSAT